MKSPKNQLRDAIGDDQWADAARIVGDSVELLEDDEVHWLLSLMPPGTRPPTWDPARSARHDDRWFE